MTASHQIRFPSAQLQSFVKCYLDISMGQAGHAFHCTLPAKLEQCIFFSTGAIPLIRDKARYEQGNILCAGDCCHVRGSVNSTNMQLGITGALDMFVVIFQPSGFFRLFNIPAVHFADTFTASSISIGRDWEDLGELVREAGTVDQRKALIEQGLLRVLGIRVQEPQAIDQAILRAAGSPLLSVGELAGSSYLSERQFRRKFMERTGLSPQAFKRISRAGLALRMKRDDPARSWRSIAFESGYTDQSHFRKEMKLLMGIDHPGMETNRQFVNVEGTDFKLLASRTG